MYYSLYTACLKIKMKHGMAAVIAEASSIIDVTKHCLQINIQPKLNHFLFSAYIFASRYNLGKWRNSQYLVST